MRYVSTKLILLSVALMLSAGAALALPKCKGSPTKSWSMTKNWHNCTGVYIFTGWGLTTGHTFSGEYQNGERYGYGTWTFPNNVRKGFWIGSNQYARDPSKKVSKPTVLKSTFSKLPLNDREIIQSNLKALGLYKSSIDGLYGKGTAAALTAYNKQNNNNSDLTKSDNASKLMTALLAVTASPTPKPKVKQTIETTKTLPTCPSSGNRQNCFGTKTFASGAKYVGEFKDGKEDGQGTLTFPDGDNYVGEFKDGDMNGLGTTTFANGNKYVGEYKDGERNGHFEVTYADGGTYTGQFKDDKKSGQGTSTFADGESYVGEYKDGKKDGQGTTTFPDGDNYVGEFKDGKKDGQGTYTFANGNKYVGEFKDDKRNGHFEVTYADGGTYTGQFKDDKIDGQGTLTFPDGENYVGEFKDGKKDGQGTSTFADGTVQEGIWKDGEFQYANKLSPPAPVVKTPTQSDEIISASSGSGFAVSADGYVITNNHVIEGCQEVMVHTKNKDVTMRVITYDPQNDLALLKGDFRPSQVFALSSDYPELLQDVYVAGYPFGKAISASVKVTKGIISSLTGIGNNSSNIQIDAALQSGNSGGPIIDELGNVVGVAVSKLDAKYMFDNFGSIPENTNFGIKSNTVRNILASNDVANPPPNQSTISKSLLGKMISNGTYYISCWMTMAQVEKLRTKKVLFESFE